MLFVGINGLGIEGGRREREGERGRERIETETGPAKEKKVEKKEREREKSRLGTNERLFQPLDVCTYIRYPRLNHRSDFCIFTANLVVSR